MTQPPSVGITAYIPPVTARTFYLSQRAHSTCHSAHILPVTARTFHLSERVHSTCHSAHILPVTAHILPVTARTFYLSQRAHSTCHSTHILPVTARTFHLSQRAHSTCHSAHILPVTARTFYLSQRAHHNYVFHLCRSQLKLSNELLPDATALEKVKGLPRCSLVVVLQHRPSSYRCPLLPIGSLLPPLVIVFIFPFTQSFHLSCGLPFLQPGCV